MLSFFHQNKLYIGLIQEFLDTIWRGGGVSKIEYGFN